MHRNKGFTLIELLIVISIVGVLAALVTVNLQDARQRARDTQRKSDLRAIRNALELYKNDQSPPQYSPDLDTLQTGNYMQADPVDPLYKQAADSWPDYSYVLDPLDTLQYTLTACLENTGDIDKDVVNICSSGWSYTLVQP